MKKLPAIVDTIEKIPGRLRDHYDCGEDGRWRLQVEAVDGLELGDVAGAQADADRLFAKLSERIRADVIDGAVRAAGGDLVLLAPHVAAHVDVDRKTLAVRVLGKDGRFCSVKALVDELRERPGFEAAFDNPVTTGDRAPGATRGNLTDQMRAEKARREGDAQKAAASVPRPVLDPRSAGFSMTSAMAWARGNPERTAEVIRAQAGR